MPEPARRAALAEAVGLAIILCFAAFVRFQGLDATPPGLSYDEAMNGVDIYHVFNGYREPFFPDNNGREGLFIYAQALSVAAFGPTPWALRAVSAVAGVAAVLATWALARAWFGRPVGLLAAGLLASLLPHLVLSRLGLRAICVPLALAATLWLFWRTLRTARLRDGVLAGVALGLALQTYLSARLIPVALVLLLAGEWAANRKLLALPARRRALVGMAVLAAVTFAPLGVYFARHPDQLATRSSQVTVQVTAPAGDPLRSSLADSLPRTLGMFNVAGDENWRHNLGGRPVFDLVNGLLFLVGLGLAVRSVRARSAGAPAFHPYAWLLTGFGLLLLPGLVSQESPHFLRTIGVLPLAAVFPALGATAAGRWLGRLLGRAARRSGDHSAPVVALRRAVPCALAVALLGGTAALNYRTFWEGWAPAPATWWAFDGRLLPAVGAIRAHVAAGGDPRAVALHCPRVCAWSPVLAFFVPPAGDIDRYDTANTIYPLFAPSGADQVHVAIGTEPFRLARDYFPQVGEPEVAYGPEHVPVMARTTVPAGAIAARRAALRPLALDFEAARLEGFGITGDGAVAAGGRLTVDLLWRVADGGETNFGPNVALVDEAGAVWAADDRQGAAHSGWRAGEAFLSRHVLEVPADAPPGTYTLRVGLALRSVGEQPSRVLRGLGRPAELAEIRVGPPVGDPPEPPPIGRPDGRTLRPGLMLDQVAPLPESVRAGEPVALTVRWRVERGGAATEAQLVQGARVLAAAQAPSPEDGAPRWLRGRYVLAVPRAAAAGEARLRIVDPEGGAALDLGPVRVEAPERQLTARPLAQTTHVDFGADLALAGWTVEACPGGARALRLTLEWQARRETETAYTVFVHVIGPDGRILAQRDRPPREGDYPTTAWLAGEYVLDPVAVPLPEAARGLPLHVIAGLYDPRDGRRLPSAPGPSAGPDYAVLADGLAGCR